MLSNDLVIESSDQVVVKKTWIKGVFDTLLMLPTKIKNTFALRSKKNLYHFLSQRVTCEERCGFKDIIVLPTLKEDYCVITNVDWIRTVLKHRRLEEGSVFGEGRQMVVVSEAMGRYRMSKGRTDSKQKRNIMAQLLSNPIRYLDVMLSESNELVEKWCHEHGPISVDQDLANYSVSMYLHSIFNYRGDVEPVANILQKQIDLLGQRLAYKSMSAKSLEKKFKQLRATLMGYLAKDPGLLSTTEYTETLSNYINKHHKEIAKDAFETGLNGAALMGYLAPHPSFLMLVYEVGKHPDIQEALKNEIAGVDISAKEEVAKYIKDETTLLQAVVHEVLRLHPPQPLVFRKCVADANFNGVFVKKGSQILLDLYHSLRDKAVWGNDAECFRPQRFIDVPNLNKRAFIAYSSGPNNCTGQMFSRVSMKALLYTLITRFSWETVSEPVNHYFHFAMAFDKEVRIRVQS